MSFAIKNRVVSYFKLQRKLFVPTNPELNPNFAAGGLMEIEGGNKDVQDLGKFSVEEYNKKLHSLNGVSSGKLTFDEEGGIRIRP
ncbi:hypothetical protein Ancab_002089 [Ancistrocladus abbreviatus]